VLKPADLGLFHLHRAQLDALVDRDAADVIDDPLAVLDGSLAKLLEGDGSRRNRFVHVVKNAVASGGAATVRRMRRGAKLFEHLLDDGLDDLFGGLHWRVQGSGFRVQPR
jgi:hypothetical protein